MGIRLKTTTYSGARPMSAGTGHTYVVYGPLAAGGTILMYEGAPTFPDGGRF